jgi:hypothetical protein
MVAEPNEQQTSLYQASQLTPVLFELGAVLRGGQSDQGLGSGIERQAAKVSTAKFSGNNSHIIARHADSAVRQARDNTADTTAFCRGIKGNDRLALGRTTGAAQKICQAANARNLTTTQKFGIGLAKQVDL